LNLFFADHITQFQPV